MNIKFVNISEINELKFLKKDIFIENYHNLIFSIKENNFIFPIHCVIKQKKVFVFDGIKRFHIANHLNLKKIPIILHNYNSEKKILIDHIKFNLYREVNEIELSNFINIAINYFNEKLLAKYILSKILKKFSDKLINNYLLLNKLILLGKKLLVEKKLNIYVAINISKLDVKSQEIFLSLVKNLKLNSNKQKKLYEYIFDLSKRFNKSFSDILKNFKKYYLEDYSKELENNFFEEIKKLHSPDFYNFQKNFLKTKKELLKNIKGSNLLSPTNFEDDILKLEIFFKDFKELKNKIEMIDINLEKFTHQ